MIKLPFIAAHLPGQSITVMALAGRWSLSKNSNADRRATGKGRPPACLLGVTGLKAVLEFALLKMCVCLLSNDMAERLRWLIFLRPIY